MMLEMSEWSKNWPAGHIEREREARRILAEVDAATDESLRREDRGSSIVPAVVNAIAALTRAVILVAAELTIANRRT